MLAYSARQPNKLVIDCSRISNGHELYTHTHTLNLTQTHKSTLIYLLYRLDIVKLMTKSITTSCTHTHTTLQFSHSSRFQLHNIYNKKHERLSIWKFETVLLGYFSFLPMTLSPSRLDILGVHPLKATLQTNQTKKCPNLVSSNKTIKHMRCAHCSHFSSLFDSIFCVYNPFEWISIDPIFPLHRLLLHQENKTF